MVLSAPNVAVALTGVVSRAPLATAAPTTQASALAAGFIDVGYIGEDGITQSTPGSGDLNTIKAWQNGAVVRTIRSATEDLPTFQFVMIESKAISLETYYGSTVTTTVTEGSLVYNATTLRTRFSWVFDYVDGAELERIYVPDGLVTEVGDRVWANGDPVGYEVTVEAQSNATLGGHFKLWSTRGKA